MQLYGQLGATRHAGASITIAASAFLRCAVYCPHQPWGLASREMTIEFCFSLAPQQVWLLAKGSADTLSLCNVLWLRPCAVCQFPFSRPKTGRTFTFVHQVAFPDVNMCITCVSVCVLGVHSGLVHLVLCAVCVCVCVCVCVFVFVCVCVVFCCLVLCLLYPWLVSGGATSCVCCVSFVTIDLFSSQVYRRFLHLIQFTSCKQSSS